VIKDSSAVNQLKLSFYQGHEGQKINIKQKIDVGRFLKPAEVESLKLWSTRFFSAKLNALV